MSEGRKIYCEGCGKYVGEIRDAKLLKGLVHLCDTCNTKRKAAENAIKFKAKGPADDFLKEIFRGR